MAGLCTLVFLAGSLLVGLATGPVSISAGAIAESALSHLPLLHVRSPLGPVDQAIVGGPGADHQPGRLLEAGLVGHGGQAVR